MSLDRVKSMSITRRSWERVESLSKTLWTYHIYFKHYCSKNVKFYKRSVGSLLLTLFIHLSIISHSLMVLDGQISQ